MEAADALSWRPWWWCFPPGCRMWCPLLAWCPRHPDWWCDCCWFGGDAPILLVRHKRACCSRVAGCSAAGIAACCTLCFSLLASARDEVAARLPPPPARVKRMRAEQTIVSRVRAEQRERRVRSGAGYRGQWWNRARTATRARRDVVTGTAEAQAIVRRLRHLSGPGTDAA